MVRQSIKKIQEIYPHWRPKKDHVICPRNPKNKENSILDSDYLDDLFSNCSTGILFCKKLGDIFKKLLKSFLYIWLG